MIPVRRIACVESCDAHPGVESCYANPWVESCYAYPESNLVMQIPGPNRVMPIPGTSRCRGQSQPTLGPRRRGQSLESTVLIGRDEHITTSTSQSIPLDDSFNNTSMPSVPPSCDQPGQGRRKTTDPSHEVQFSGIAKPCGCSFRNTQLLFIKS